MPQHISTTARTATHSGGDDPARIDYRLRNPPGAVFQPRCRWPGVTIKRQREAELRRELREMRDSSIGTRTTRTKNLIRTEVGSENYPPDLETLVTGVDITVGGTRKLVSAPLPWPLQAGRQRAVACPARHLPLSCRRRCDTFEKFQWIR